MELLPLKGYKALRAFNAFNVLLLGVKMLPAYSSTPYEEFYASFKDKSEADKEAFLREGAAFVELSEEEVKALVSFAKDPNGIPYSSVNINSLGVEQIFEIIIAVCMEIGRIKIDLISEEEKKKLKLFSVDVTATYAKHPELELSEILNLAFYEALKKCSQNFLESYQS